MKQDLALLICAVMKNADDDYAHQAYLESEFGRIMMCYTDDRYFGKSDIEIVSFGTSSIIQCVPSPLCDVIANCIQKEEIGALVFNKGTDHMYTIPIPLIEMAILKNCDY